METHIQATEDALIDSLSFKLPNSANFISDRRAVTFFPSGGNQYSPQGVKIIKFMITGTDWLDPSTVRVSYRLNNIHPNRDLRPINALPANFFRRMRILCGGAVIEDIDFYNRVYNMVHTLFPAERRQNDAAEGFGLNTVVYPRPGAGDPPQATHVNPAFAQFNNCPSIPGGGNKVVFFPLLCGILNQPKFLPLRFLQGLQIELEVVNNLTDPIAVGRRAEDITSQEWYIDQPVIKCDVVTLDSQLDNEYTDHLMQGKSLPINYSSFVHQVQAIGGTDRPVISMSRAFTRLKTVYCTFFKTVTDWTNNDNVDAVPTQQINLPATEVPLKECNFFYHPQYVYNPDGFTLNVQNTIAPFNQQQGFIFQYNTEVEAQLQIGSKLIPEIPMRSSAEAYYQLRKALGSHAPGSVYAINIPDHEYRTHKFILAFDCERQTNTGFSGLNTRTGDLITLKVQNLKHVDNLGRFWPGTFAEFLHTTLEYDAIMTISDAGVQVLE